MIDVSVVIPTYNSSKFLRTCVKSVIQQRDISLEVIIVDDKGTDDTAAQITALQGEHDNIKAIFRPKPTGQATARNEGIEVASGRYIALLDSDDVLASEDVLSRWVQSADENEAEIVVAQFNNISRKGTLKPARPVPQGSVTSAERSGILANVTSCWQLLYLKSFLDSEDVRFSTKLRQREDRLFVLQALLKARRVAVSDVIAINHLYRPGSSVTIMDLDQIRQYNQHLTEYLDYLDHALKERSVSKDFVDANTILYLLQLLKYWGPFIRRNISAPGDEIPKEVEEYLFTMNKMSQSSGAFYTYGGLNVDQSSAAQLAEGNVDMCRLILSQRRWGLLHKFLSGQRLSIATVKGLAEEAKEPWAEEACCRYLSFNRVAMLHEKSDPQKLGRLVKKLVLHVGLPKTGSSALQQALERNRFNLLRSGFHYPVAGTNRERTVRRERINGHARLIQSIVDGDSSFLSELVGEIESLEMPIHTLILSSENIVSSRFWAEGAIIPMLIGALGIEDVEVVLVLREPGDWFHSYYREMCANPWNGFITGAEKCLKTIREEGLLNFENIIGVIAAEVGKNSLSLQSYEQLISGGGIVDWFTKKFEVPQHNWLELENAHRNVSVSDNVAAQIVLAKSTLAKKQELADIFNCACKMEESIQSDYSLFSPKEQKLIRQILCEATNMYHRLFASTPKVIAQGSRDGGPRAGVIQISSEIYAKIAAGSHLQPVDTTTDMENLSITKRAFLMLKEERYSKAKFIFVILTAPLAKLILADKNFAQYLQDPIGSVRTNTKLLGWWRGKSTR